VNSPSSETIPYELDARLIGIVSQGHVRLPPYPAVAAQLADLLSTDDYDLASIEELIAADQVLTASVLRLARSAAMGGGRAPVSTLTQALSRVGSSAVMLLAFASGAGAHANAAGTLKALRRETWRRSVYAAEICRVLARLYRIPPGEAFLAGLLHDFGEVVTLASLEEMIGGAAKKVSAKRCQKVARNYHVEVGLVIADHWRLPESVKTSIAGHHRAEADSSAVVRLVAAADAVVERIEAGLPVVAVPQDSPFPETAKVLLEDLLPTLPDLLSNFESDAKPAPQSEFLEKDPTTLGEVQPASFRASIGSRKFRGVGIAPDGIVIEGSQGLAEQSVVKVDMGDGRGFWAVVSLHQVGKKSHRMELRPTLFDEEAEGRWQSWTKRFPSAQVSAVESTLAEGAQPSQRNA